MSLNPKSVEFIYKQLINSTFNTFESTAAQLYDYLNEEVKDNVIYQKYIAEEEKWKNWISQEKISRGNWAIPKKLEEAKSFVFYLYKLVAAQGYRIATALFDGQKISDSIHKMNSTLGGYLAEALNDIINANPEIDNVAPQKTIGNTVFIIHGHDNELKVQLQLLLKVAGVNNFVLHEQPDKGRTIIEKLVQETESSGYAVALLTPDDLLDNGNNRARQNVILELGYFLGKIGKERVRIIVRDDVEIPTDLQGVLYEKYDASGAWKMKLLKEIQAVGIYVDLGAAVKSL